MGFADLNNIIQLKNTNQELCIGLASGSLLGLLMYYTLTQTVESIESKSTSSKLKGFAFTVSLVAFLLTVVGLVLVLNACRKAKVFKSFDMTKRSCIEALVVMSFAFVYLCMMAAISHRDYKKSKVMKMNFWINIVLDFIVAGGIGFVGYRLYSKLKPDVPPISVTPLFPA